MVKAPADFSVEGIPPFPRAPDNAGVQGPLHPSVFPKENLKFPPGPSAARPEETPFLLGSGTPRSPLVFWDDRGRYPSPGSAGLMKIHLSRPSHTIPGTL